MEGMYDGLELGVIEGDNDGFLLGKVDGFIVGCVGERVGIFEGDVGIMDGIFVGDTVGKYTHVIDETPNVVWPLGQVKHAD